MLECKGRKESMAVELWRIVYPVYEDFLLSARQHVSYWLVGSLWISGVITLQINPSNDTKQTIGCFRDVPLGRPKCDASGNEGIHSRMEYLKRLLDCAVSYVATPQRRQCNL
jgi:hypothetical protein